MIQDQQTQPLSLDQIRELVDQVSTQWVDQFNANLLLTVQAVQKLHSAFDSKFTR